MTLVILYQREDGGVSVVIPAPEYVGQIEAVAANDVPPGAVWRIVDASDLPPRESRDRWRWTDDGHLAVSET